MNLYYIDGGMLIDQGEDYYEEFWAGGLYAAETRGKAHAMFCTEHGLDWLDSAVIRQIDTGLDIPSGVVNDSILWIQASAIVHGYTDAEEFYEWQYLFENDDNFLIYDEAVIE